MTSETIPVGEVDEVDDEMSTGASFELSEECIDVGFGNRVAGPLCCEVHENFTAVLDGVELRFPARERGSFIYRAWRLDVRGPGQLAAPPRLEIDAELAGARHAVPQILRQWDLLEHRKDRVIFVVD